MPRQVSNPPNPWSTSHVEWLGEPPAVALQVYEEHAKSVVASNDSPDVPFRYSVNPYRGCQHACAYCYARPGHQYLGFGAGTDFDARIVVKTNAAACLERELRRGKLNGEWLAFSGVTDCYQPLEASYGITRACLEVCRDQRVPVGIVTKSALVRRDVDLLAELERVAGARVFLSIPFASAEHARKLEPWAAAPAARFETIRRLSEAGIQTGVAIAPMIPGLGEPDIPEILERAHAAGARSAFMILLRLEREVRGVFEERLRAQLPLRAEKVLSAFEEMRAGGGFGQRMVGSGARWKSVRDLFELTCRRLGLDTRGGEPTEPISPDRVGTSQRPTPRGPVQGTLFDTGGRNTESHT